MKNYAKTFGEFINEAKVNHYAGLADDIEGY